MIYQPLRSHITIGAIPINKTGGLPLFIWNTDDPDNPHITVSFYGSREEHRMLKSKGLLLIAYVFNYVLSEFIFKFPQLRPRFCFGRSGGPPASSECWSVEAVIPFDPFKIMLSLRGTLCSNSRTKNETHSSIEGKLPDDIEMRRYSICYLERPTGRCICFASPNKDVTFCDHHYMVLDLRPFNERIRKPTAILLPFYRKKTWKALIRKQRKARGNQSWILHPRYMEEGEYFDDRMLDGFIAPSE